MKTMEELYQEVLGSDELKGAFARAVSEGRVEEFLKENGCEASLEEVKAFLGGGEGLPAGKAGEGRRAVRGGAGRGLRRLQHDRSGRFCGNGWHCMRIHRSRQCDRGKYERARRSHTV